MPRPAATSVSPTSGGPASISGSFSPPAPGRTPSSHETTPFQRPDCIDPIPRDPCDGLVRPGDCVYNFGVEVEPSPRWISRHHAVSLYEFDTGLGARARLPPHDRRQIFRVGDPVQHEFTELC